MAIPHKYRGPWPYMWGAEKRRARKKRSAGLTQPFRSRLGQKDPFDVNGKDPYKLRGRTRR